MGREQMEEDSKLACCMMGMWKGTIKGNRNIHRGYQRLGHSMNAMSRADGRANYQRSLFEFDEILGKRSFSCSKKKQ